MNGTPLPVRAELQPVQLVEDVATYGRNKLMRQPAPEAVRATLVVQNDDGFPGIVLADGSVLVLSWAQMRTLRDVFDQWAELNSQEHDA